MTSYLGDKNLFAPTPASQYRVIYNGNGNILGSVPTDNTDYSAGASAIILNNTNNLAKTGFYFSGWNTSSNATGTNYFPGDTLIITSNNVILYALWKPIVGSIIVYDGNGNTFGDAPIDSNGYIVGQAITILDNSYNLAKPAYIFAGWNTLSDGGGTNYLPGEIIPATFNDLTLYAFWNPIPGIVVIYDGNGNISGKAPIDNTAYQYSDNAIVLGNPYNLAKPGFIFAGWNTSSDGSGTGYSPGAILSIPPFNITLYAMWSLPLSRGVKLF